MKCVCKSDGEGVYIEERGEMEGGERRWSLKSRTMGMILVAGGERGTWGFHFRTSLGFESKLVEHVAPPSSVPWETIVLDLHFPQQLEHGRPAPRILFFFFCLFLFSISTKTVHK